MPKSAPEKLAQWANSRKIRSHRSRALSPAPKITGPRRAKRCYSSCIQIRNSQSADGSARSSSSKIPIWGGKRARSALHLGADDGLRFSSPQIPVLGTKMVSRSGMMIPVLGTKQSSLQISTWGATRARSGALYPLNPAQHKWRDTTNQRSWGHIGLLGTKQSQQIPSWGSRRARGGALCPLNPDQHKWRDTANQRSWGQITVLGSKPSHQRGGALCLADPHKWRDWTNLGDGPTGLIADFLLAGDVVDYICFRTVCRTWRLWSTDPRKHGVLDRRFHPRQWIMLREKGSPACRRGFMNVAAGYCRYVNLPELCGHDMFGPTTEGLLVLLDRTTWVVRILNPFTRQAVDLPPAIMLMSSSDLELTDCRNDLRRIYLQVSGAGLASDSTIAIHFRGIRTVAIVRPGDVKWTVVDRGRSILPALSFAGRFYCATTEAVMVVETSTDHPPQLAIVAKLNRPFSRIMKDTVHLVDNGGELTLVDRECKGSKNHRKYKLYKVDFDAGKMVPVSGLGGRAVFIGLELAISVSPEVFPSIDADTIYLGFDELLQGIMDYSPIHLIDGTSEPRQFYGSRNGVPLYGPLGVDYFLSLSVAGYRDDSNNT